MPKAAREELHAGSCSGEVPRSTCAGQSGGWPVPLSQTVCLLSTSKSSMCDANHHGLIADDSRHICLRFAHMVAVTCVSALQQRSIRPAAITSRAQTLSACHG